MACHDEPGLMSLEDCRARLLASVALLAAETRVSLDQAAGRVLAQPLQAALEAPSADQSAMDGYALHGDDLAGCPVAPRVLRVAGTSLAGHPWPGTLQAGSCVRIMTGAVVPAGAAAVVMQEDVQRENDVVVLPRTLRPGENIRPRGEDTRVGDALLPAGRRLSAADIGLLASQGLTEVPVREPLRVALLSTGDELVPPGLPLASGQIHDSNRPMLQAALAGAGFEVIDLGHVRDDRDALRARFLEASRSAQAVITTGGVSVGEADLVRQVVGELGHVGVWRIAIKPGKPFAFGELAGTAFFGLPGNPVSALVTWRQLALPALLRLQGATWQPPLRVPAHLLAPVRKKPGRAEFQRGVLAWTADGDMTVTPLAAQGSGLLTSLSQGNAFLVLPRDGGDLPAGATVLVEPY